MSQLGLPVPLYRSVCLSLEGMASSRVRGICVCIGIPNTGTLRSNSLDDNGGASCMLGMPAVCLGGQLCVGPNHLLVQRGVLLLGEDGIVEGEAVLVQQLHGDHRGDVQEGVAHAEEHAREAAGFERSRGVKSPNRDTTKQISSGLGSRKGRRPAG